MNLSDAQAAAVRAVPGMERAHIQLAKKATGELQEYVAAQPQRWQEVKGHMANALPPQADLFKKKVRESTWEDTKPLVAGAGHIRPPRASLGELTIAWSRESLVEEEAAPEEESLDPWR